MSAHLDGRVDGYSSGKTLPFRTELRRQFGRRRTQLSIGFLALLPVILAIAFAVGSDSADSDAGGLIELGTRGGVNFTVFALFMSVGFLLIVVVALFFGDSVASEASWSSLRYLLAIPVPRTRLLMQKALVSATLSIAAIATLVVVSLGLGTVLYGAEPLVTPFGDGLSYAEALGRLLIAVLYICINLLWVAGLAMLLSVLTDAPLGAVGGAVMTSILMQILDQITALGSLRNYLPGHYANTWIDALSPTIEWNDMVVGSFSALAYAAVFGIAAWQRFSTKDITS
ncbi:MULTISPECIES: ABC transporter permease [Nocardiaceae]|jgi:ABC-2 type transport system permease protein|uniref:ABC transporter permease n=1 Tax=Nocardiaceae TaxID=85025 RepID=UPI0005693CC0|nr:MULTISPECIES: ABC transporter permease subunit [Rhodococcus]OZE95740.1 ABC transporter permease [Rhodococcus sp. 15-1189-1-1a]OZF10439.1 ABC transporter permease [Rhodococcus sp. 14-2686-1-2]OZF45671.1 ABC transporter permease [Rhodococcus sp. 14-2470-1b]